MKSKEAFMDLIKLNLGKPLNNAGDNEIYKKMDLVSDSLEALDIIKTKKVDVKLVLWAGQSVEAYNVVVREKNLFPREELTQEEFYLIREVLNNG